MTEFALTTTTTSRFKLEDKFRSEKWGAAQNCGFSAVAIPGVMGRPFFRAVYTGTRPGVSPRHQGGEGVAGTPGACSQVFCHPNS